MHSHLIFSAKKNGPRTGASLQRGFTLIETMVGTLIFTIAMVALLGTTLAAYRYMLISRYQDRAMNVLTTLADQFQNSPLMDKSNAGHVKDIFNTSFPTNHGGFTCAGMAWDTDRQFFIYPDEASAFPNSVSGGTIASPQPSLVIPLSTVSDATSVHVTGTLTRQVQAFSDPYPSTSATPTGLMILGTFRITYNFLGTQTLQVSALRTITPTDEGKNTNATVLTTQ